MTADWVHLPYDFLMKVSNDIINKVKGIVNREWYMMWFKTACND
jgi:GMP synthase (glutamine-hydrolysing)